MSVRPIIDAGPGLNFLSSNKERGLCETLFEEVQANGSPKRGQEGFQRPSVIGEENPPCLQVCHGPLDWRPMGADLVVVVVFAHVQLAVHWLADRGGDVAGSDESLVTEHAACHFKDRLAF